MLSFLAISSASTGPADPEFEELARLIASEHPELERHDCRGGFSLFAPQGSRRSQARAERAAGDSERSASFLVGRAFWRGSPSAEPLTTGPIVDERLSADGAQLGRLFAQSLWGDYLLFSRSPGQLCVTRDPKGALPCFHLAWGSCTIWFGNIADLPAGIRRTLKPDFEIIRLNFYCPKMAKRRTGLAKVGQVMAGTTLVVDDRSPAILENWKPDDFIPAARTDLDKAVRSIKESVLEVVTAYGRHFDNPLVSIGGLDSSIIWCLADRFLDRKLYGLSLHSDAQRGDERRYVSSLPGLERIAMLPMAGERINPEAVFTSNLAVSPHGFVDLVDLSWEREALGEGAGFDAVLYGIGGDNVFLQAADIYPACDYVRANGLAPAAFGHIADSARYAPSSISRVLFSSLKELVGKGDNWEFFLDYSLSRLDRSGYAREFIADLPAPFDLHPGYGSIGSVGKGKALQILSACFCASEYYDMHHRAQFERCELYLSQPILEACLGIPSWMLAFGGVDRGLARMAFADVIPGPILQRTSKSGPEEVYDRFVELHLARVRDYLTEGVLMREGIISQASLETLFESDLATGKPRSHRLISLVSNEAWARQWA